MRCRATATMRVGVSIPPAARVRLAPLDAVADEAAADAGNWLTTDEASRLQAMSAPARRRSFLAGHWFARRLAADWLQADVARIALDRHDDGRPRLLVDGAPSPLSLSLSHSGDWLACVIANVPVGIDVELPRRLRNLQALARFTFAPEEVERLLLLPDEQRRPTFHLLWTLKEARGKRSGEGLLPEQSRRINTLQSEAAEADAISWPFHDGALALAVDAGTEIGVEGGGVLGSPAFWRYVESR